MPEGARWWDFCPLEEGLASGGFSSSTPGPASPDFGPGAASPGGARVLGWAGLGAAPARRAGLEKNASASINLNWILLLVLRVEPLSPGRPDKPAPRNLVRVALVHAGDGLRDHAFLEPLLSGSAELCSLGVLGAAP